MKKLLLILLTMLFASCGQHYCPAYGYKKVTVGNKTTYFAPSGMVKPKRK